MAFPARMMSEKADYVGISATLEWKPGEFIDYMNVVAIYCEDDVEIKFNSMDNKTFPHLGNLIFNWFFPIKTLYIRTTKGTVQVHAWGEKV